MVCALLEDENGYFCENELRMFRMVEKQSGRLRDEAARTLREYVLQVRELFQAEIDLQLLFLLGTYPQSTNSHQDGAQIETDALGEPYVFPCIKLIVFSS